jgi:cytochrome c peroxidase
VLFVLAGAVVAQNQEFQWNIPAPFPKPYVPPDNPMNSAKVELGRRLFYDTRMSVNGKQSCATCHRRARAQSLRPIPLLLPTHAALLRDHGNRHAQCDACPHLLGQLDLPGRIGHAPLSFFDHRTPPA